MDIFRIEKLRIDLQDKLTAEKSPFVQIKLLNNFFIEIINQKDNSVLEAFITEFIPTYLTASKNIRAIGTEPKIINNEISLFEEITKSQIFSEYSDTINIEIKRLRGEINAVQNSLDGTESDVQPNILSFPVKINNYNSEYHMGQIETFTVKIDDDSSLKEDKFLIVPTFKEVDEQLEEQIRTSWYLAIDYLKNHYKYPSKFHEVVLIFNNKFAHFEGFSLGLSISIGFVQALFKYYNTELSLTLSSNVTFSGGFDKNKKIRNLGENIIRQKTETVFYSPYNYFAIPDNDAPSAKEELTDLKALYPQRKLKIINIEDFDDLMNHRQIISIEKAKITERTRKFVGNNKLSISLSLILATIILLISIYTIDKNPHEYEIIGNTINILNKHGKVLWSKAISWNEEFKSNPNLFQRIYDVNNDGRNEVLLTSEILENPDINNFGRIACFDSYGKLIWKYKFRDTVYTDRSYKDQYINRIIDIIKLENRNILFAISRHNFFPSAIFQLDAQTGKRLDGTYWNQGHLNDGMIVDSDNDGNLEIFAGGINNGLEIACALIIDIDKLNGQTPTIPQYTYNNLPIGKIKKLFLFEKTDLCKLYKNRFNGVEHIHFSESMDQYEFYVDEKHPEMQLGPAYIMNNNFDSAWVQIGDDFQFVRDNLIKDGELRRPFTTEKEYEKTLVDGIKEWNGKEFVQFPAKKRY